ncbi:MAG TPA: anti-sigma factor [Caulobacteraceae bacterium]|jgi:anti-sigma factor RsiW
MSAPCLEQEPMLHALLDGELDAANASALEAHLASCPGCAQRLQTLRALHERLAQMPPPAAPAALKGRIEAMIGAEAKTASRPQARAARPGLLAGWLAAGAMTAVAASLVVTPLAIGPSLPMQLADAHVRSLQADHLVDIPTSDRHVVRPWFDGKIGFAAPPAPDLKDQGFPLVGGRLDYADGRPIAAIVYRRRAHVINLFVLPARGGLALPRFGPAPGGYAMLHWTDRGLDYWAVSDAEPDELKGFKAAFEKAEG